MKISPKVFVPFTEALSSQMLDDLGLSSTDLVPFQLDYQCVAIELADVEAATQQALSETEA